ncbi:hypothetical protein [Streptomyces sp. RFCAC02]|uniref:YqeB family protein n=1 Tax=Streptomyces sp. RFCAC02 TaxID=2499143 RepID=UPI0010207278|nr:hypothetical protein [Streptomyces sp. RFCAC02]
MSGVERWSDGGPGDGSGIGGTVLGLPRADRAVLVVGGPLLGVLVGAVLPPVADWAVSLPHVPMRAPLEFAASWRSGWSAVVAGCAGLLAGLGLAVVAVATSLKVTVTDAALSIRRDEDVRAIGRAEVEAVFLDGKRLVVLDGASRHLLREVTEARPADVARAFTAHGYPWLDADPYADLYRRWVPGTPDLPTGAHALLKAREAALGKRAHDDARELREGVEALGFTVREESGRQFWRPLVLP